MRQCELDNYMIEIEKQLEQEGITLSEEEKMYALKYIDNKISVKELVNKLKERSK